MRWVFIALVLANAGVFIWHSVESSRMERLEALNTSSAEGQGVMSGAPLVLLSELTDQEKQELMKVKEAPVANEVRAVSVSEVSAIEDKTPAQPAEPAKATNAPNMVSLEEIIQKDATLVVVPNQCLRIGPLPNATQAEQVSQRLMAVAIITDMVEVDVPGKPEYWVILPPLNDEKSALQKLQELQGRAIKAQIIAKGELANAISFGLHGEKEDANKQIDELSAKGYKVQIKAMPVIHKEKWLMLSERQAPKLTEDLWQNVQTDFPKLNKQIKKCH